MRLAMHVTQEPTAVRMPTHLHPYQRETFTIEAGALSYRLDGASARIAGAGDTVIVEPGVRHEWWNDGPETVEMLGVMEPAGRWVDFMETIYGLTNEGKVNARGIPNLFQIAVIAWEFRREWVPTALPTPLRLTFLPVLAAIGRLLGYRPTYPRYSEHGRAAAKV